MKPIYLLTVALTLCSTTSAQVQEGELIVVGWNAVGSSVLHYRQDGTLVEQYDFAAGPQCSLGGGVLANGHWAVTDVCGARLYVYDPVTDTEVLNVQIPQLIGPLDVEQLSDGTLVVTDGIEPKVALYDAAGNFLSLWNPPFACCGAFAAVDAKDEVWVSDGGLPRVLRLDSSGNVLSMFQPPETVGEIVVDPDGTLWLLSLCGTGTLYHYDQSGNLLGAFVVPGLQSGCGIGLVRMPDGTFWASEASMQKLHHVDQAGNYLGSITLPTGFTGITLSTVEPERIGVKFCDAKPNSTGKSGAIVATGSDVLGDNAIDLLAHRLPPQEVGYVLNSRGRAELPVSNGTLCLGGDIGRHTAQVANTGDAGIVATRLDLLALPRPAGSVSAIVGETWYFTLWHRDGAATNFTDAISISLR